MVKRQFSLPGEIRRSEEFIFFIGQFKTGTIEIFPLDFPAG
jgi:hypothetical protein